LSVTPSGNIPITLIPSTIGLFAPKVPYAAYGALASPLLPPISTLATCTAGVAESIANTLREAGRSDSSRASKLALTAADCLSTTVDPPTMVRSW
jgi:hypothetical protein